MWKALVTKELHELSGIAGLALLAYLFVLVRTTQEESYFLVGSERFDGIPLVSDAFHGQFVLVTGLLVTAVGLRQTLGESVRGTWLFLLHRPMRRHQLIAAKLILGGGLCLLLAALPIVLFAWWAATPGTHASPFRISMALVAWRSWLSMTPVYLGAFLAGLRPGRWVGTRLLPLLAAGLLAIALQACPRWWLVGLPCLALLDAWLAATILYVARTRDY